MFFAKFFTHVDVIFKSTVISLKIVLLSKCYFLHLYINLILKNIPQSMNLRDIYFPQYSPNWHKKLN